MIKSKKEKLEQIKELRKVINEKDSESMFYPVFLNILSKLNKLEESLGEEE